ncbi:MAG: hypothetical protein ACXVDB_08255 [Tumebacillaceae bacterium]
MKHDWVFVGTPLSLTDGEAYHLQKYLKKGRAAGTIVAWERFDLDLAALRTPVQLDCQNCHLAHQESCCEGGFPFPPATELLPVLDAHINAIAAEHLPEAVRAQIEQQGLYASHLETAGYPTIGTYAGNCLFCQTEAHGPACMAHRYALQTGMAPEELKPLSCLLYPLDLIADSNGRVLVTALTERTASFSRWGADYRLDFLCGNRELRVAIATGEHEEVRANIRRELPDDAFALDRYRPAYQEAKATLLHLYGEALWNEIDTRIGNLPEKETSLT